MWDIEPVVEMLYDEGASLVVEYGSSKCDRESANDIDLFALYNDGMDRTDNVRLGNFEIIRLTKSELRSFRQVLDPVYCVEPILEGEVRHGDTSTFESLRDQINTQSPTDRAIRHNLRRSHSEYTKAAEFLNGAKIKKGVETLSFAASHRLFAEWYDLGNTPESLRTVRSRLTTTFPVSDVFEAVECSKENESLTESNLELLLRSWEQAELKSNRLGSEE